LIEGYIRNLVFRCGFFAGSTVLPVFGIMAAAISARRSPNVSRAAGPRPPRLLRALARRGSLVTDPGEDEYGSRA